MEIVVDYRLPALFLIEAFRFKDTEKNVARIANIDASSFHFLHKIMFKIVDKISVVYLQEQLKLSSEIDSRTTRSALSKKIFIKKLNTKSEVKFFTTRAASVEFVALWVDLHGKFTTVQERCRCLL